MLDGWLYVITYSKSKKFLTNKIWQVEVSDQGSQDQD